MVKICKRVLLTSFIVALVGIGIVYYNNILSYLDKHPGASAFATIVLVIITLAYVIITWKLAKTSEESTKATMKHVIIAQESNEIQVRPVVVWELTKEEGLPVRINNSGTSFYYKLKNIGKGPALNLIIIDFRKNKSCFSLTKEGYIFSGIGAGEPQEISPKFKEVTYKDLIEEVFEGYEEDRNIKKLKNLENDSTILVYEDMFGNKFMTVYNGGSGVYSLAARFYKLKRHKI